MRRVRGFTLLELLVVLVLLTAMTALVAPAFLKGGGVEVQAAARTLAAGLRRARSQAIQRNTVETLTLDVSRREFGLSFENRTRALPEEIELSLYTAQSSLESASRGAIRFFPDGGSTGGRIGLKRDGREVYVDVAWLSGQIRVLDGSGRKARP